MQEPDNPAPNQTIPQGDGHTQVTEGQTPEPGQTPSVPGKTPTQDHVAGQTPTQDQTPVPGQTPAQVYVPGQTPAQVYVPEQTPAQVYVPGQTPAQVYVPGQTPAQVYVPGQTPQPGYVPLQTPAQGYVPGLTAAPGYVPGQTPAQVYVPGQTPAQGYVPILTAAPGYVPGQTPPQGNATEQPASPSDDFTHVYQTGNFGKHFGKVNTARGKKYTIVHGVLSLPMIIFTITASDMMKRYMPGPLKDRLLGVTWLCAVCDGLSTVAAICFMWILPILTHPLTTLVVMKILATLSLFMNVFFFLVGTFSAMLEKRDFIELKDNEINLLKAFYAIITVLMVIKIFTSTAFIFHWWNCFPSSPTACACFAPYCIFEEGEDLAPGVPNAAGVQNIFRGAGGDNQLV